MEEGIECLRKNHIRTLVDLSRNQKMVGGK